MAEELNIDALKERISALKKKKMEKAREIETQKADENFTNLESPNLNTFSKRTEADINQSQGTLDINAIKNVSDNNFNKTDSPYSVFVGNLNLKTTEDQLKKHFERCGAIERSTICINHFTHIPKGYGYIQFSSQEGYDNALLLNNTELCGNTIDVKPKKEKTARQSIRRGPRRRFSRYRR